MKLSELATIKTGLVMARKQAKQPCKEVVWYKQLNLRSIHPDGYIERTYVEDFGAKETLPAEYLTQSGDIVVRLTTPYTAVLIDDEWKGVVVPSHFVIIRPDNRLLSEYLYWLLNTKKIREKLTQNVSSIMIGTIKPKSYACLDIEILSLEQQQRIARLNLLAKKELDLLERLKEQKKLYYETAIDRIQREMRDKEYEKDDKE
ncbi:restriction endonuclease subunit S [Lachnospiraceae bacterium WCA-9-b2]|uniref:Restriction endonuclease subunit S n=1 Tax=Sporofaciens musculi TaxID=2681861 RepID=A0A7X3ML91_9FIRM|nr:restriction endonuclease subunit S [Sporofaciens musculi]MXP78488.1 restriction endonuclease subunit S [Sporofaciens musculi]